MRIIHFILILLVSATVGAASASELNEFVTDGCSGVPDGNWGHCCYEHDLLYWAGGNFYDRLFADEQLKTCMNNVGGPGYIYYEGLRSGGLIAWGKAWPGRNRTPVDEIPEDVQEQILAEKRMCEASGFPGTCPRVLFENTIFPALTDAQISQVKLEFVTIKKRPDYQYFVKEYQSMQGKLPATVEFH